MRSVSLGLFFMAVLTSCSTTSAKHEEFGTWERVFYSSLNSRDLLFSDSVAVFATDKGLMYSDDGVKFKNSLSDLPGDPEVLSIASAPGVSEIYAVTDVGYLLRSTDAARTFSVIGEFPSFRVTSLAMNGRGRIFVGTSAGVLVTDRNLAEAEARRVRSYIMPWEMLVLGLPIWRRARLGSDSELWQDWSVVCEGRITRLEANPARDEHIIADIFDRGAVQSFDEGETWKPIYSETGDTVRGPISFGPNGGIIVGLHHSKDGGATWNRLGLNPDRDDMRQMNDREFGLHDVAYGSTFISALQYRAAAVYASADGAAWKRIGGPKDFYVKDRETSPSLVRMDRRGVLWAATDGHGIFRFIPKRDVENNFQLR